MVSLHQMWKHASTDTGRHDTTSLQLWIYERLYPVAYHGEANRMRDEVVRQRIEDHDADARVGDLLDDFYDAHFDEGRREEEVEATAKAYYEMLAAAQQPLHEHTKV